MPLLELNFTSTSQEEDKSQFSSPAKESNPLNYEFTVSDAEGNILRQYQISKDWEQERTATLLVLKTFLDKVIEEARTLKPQEYPTLILDSYRLQDTR